MNEPSSLAQTLHAASKGDRKAAADLLPLVYAEPRKLAKVRMAKLPPGNTLQPTALVHEAYARLVGRDDPAWDTRGHFFAAAAADLREHAGVGLLQYLMARVSIRIKNGSLWGRCAVV